MIVFFISITFLLIVQNIILINEEILVSICFIAILYVSTKKFDFITNSIFIKRSAKIKKKIIESLNQLEQSLVKIIESLNFITLITNIKLTQTYCLKLIQSFIIWSLINTLNYIKIFYPRSLKLFKVIELKIIKLITIFLLNKITSTLTTINFFRFGLAIQKFSGCNLLNLREYIYQYKKLFI